MAKPARPASVREYLSQQLERIRARKPRYSLRAFARDLKVSPSHLSQTLNGKKSLSPENGARISAALKLTPEEKRYFKLLIEIESAPQESRSLLMRKLNSLATQLDRQQVSPAGKLRSMRWEHLLILAAFELNPRCTREKVESLSGFIGISVTELQGRLRELVTADLLTFTRGVYERSHHQVLLESTDTDRTMQKIHAGYLKRAAKAVEEREADVRFSTTEFYALPKGKGSVVRARLIEFLDEVAALSEMEAPEELVEIAVHLNVHPGSEIWPTESH